MTKKRLYLILTLGLIAGYSWLAYNLWQQNAVNNKPVCFFKRTTGIPCPSCGNTRSVMAIIKGNFTDAILINPIGLIIACVMLITPLWLIYDAIYKKDTLHKNYLLFEKTIRNKYIAVILIILIIINWIWNVYKGV